MDNLPPEWHIDDFEKLTKAARQYLATIVSNNACNKAQREITKAERQTDHDHKKTTK